MYFESNYLFPLWSPGWTNDPLFVPNGLPAPFLLPCIPDQLIAWFIVHMPCLCTHPAPSFKALPYLLCLILWLSVTLLLDHHHQPQPKISPALGPLPSFFCMPIILPQVISWMTASFPPGQNSQTRSSESRALSGVVTFQLFTHVSPFGVVFRALLTIWKHPAYLFVN